MQANNFLLTRSACNSVVRHEKKAQSKERPSDLGWHIRLTAIVLLVAEDCMSNYPEGKEGEIEKSFVNPKAPRTEDRSPQIKNDRGRRDMVSGARGIDSIASVFIGYRGFSIPAAHLLTASSLIRRFEWRSSPRNTPLCAVGAFHTREIGDLSKGAVGCPSSGRVEREYGQADGSMSLDEKL